MSVPIKQALAIGAYIARQKLLGRKRYPLVLMLEPLLRCNLACAGCGKIDYPDPILDRRLSVADCLAAVDECGAPLVAIPGGEPLIHKEIGAIVKGMVGRGKFVSLCTNALLLEKKLHLFEPSDRLFFSVHLDGLKEEHDRSVCREGVFDKAVQAIRAARAKGFSVNINATIFATADPERLAGFLDFCTDELDVSGISLSPGFAYERAPDQAHFLNRLGTRQLFRDLFRKGRGRRGKKPWPISHSPIFIDFLTGKKTLRCTPWGMPTYTVFGWQRPCYLLGEGYAASFAELMADTNWDDYGTGRYEKCADCMAHCGYEPTAADVSFSNPLQVMRSWLRGPVVEGPMAPDIPLQNQRPAEDVYDRQVDALLQQTDAPRPVRVLS